MPVTIFPSSKEPQRVDGYPVKLAERAHQVLRAADLLQQQTSWKLLRSSSDTESAPALLSAGNKYLNVAQRNGFVNAAQKA